MIGRSSIRGLHAVVAAMLLAVPATAVVAQTNATCFRVYDGTLFERKPDLRPYGMARALVPDADRWWATGAPRDSMPDRSRVTDWVRGSVGTGAVLAVDLEDWPLEGAAADVQSAVGRYVTLISWVRGANPGMPVGYYGLPPIGDYWRAVSGPDSAKYQQWQQANDALSGIAAAVDVFFPSLYTFYDDPDGWDVYAVANLTEARRLAGSRPVYAFLWPQYHNSNALLGLKPLPAAAWRRELETVRQHANGVVIWGGWNFDANRPAEWDDSAPWWTELKSFLSQPGICRIPEPPSEPRIGASTVASRLRFGP